MSNIRVKLPPFTVDKVYVTLAELVDWGLAMLGIPQAWTITKGSGIKVAILDTGVVLNHPDLVGTIGDYENFVDGETIDDLNGHGTHVCGIVAARKDGAGVVGVAPECSLLVGKVLDGAGEGPDTGVASGIDWAVAHGANVISMSFGTSESSTTIQAAIQRATAAGVVCVAAAGNYGPSLDTITYPAMYGECISVGATGQDRRVADYSSRGPKVDIVAPGSNITSTYLSDGYAKMSGTSMAAPFVSGVIALYLAKLKASNEHLLTKAQMLAALIRTATDIELPGRDYAAGYGLINPDQLFYTPSVVSEPRLTIRDLTAAGQQKIRLYMSLSNRRFPVTAKVVSL